MSDRISPARRSLIWRLAFEERGNETVEWLGLSVVIVILLLAVVGYVSASGGGQIGSAVVDGMESMITAIGGGGVSTGGDGAGTVPGVEGGDPPGVVLPSIGIPSAVAGGADAGGGDTGGGGFWGQVGGFFVGIGEGVVDTVVGIGTLAWDVVRVGPITGDIYGWIDPEGQQAVYDKYSALLEAIISNPGDVLYAMVEPIVTDWEEGRYGEAVGRSVFEIALFFVPGDEAGKAGVVARIDALTPDEMASALARLDALTPDEAASILARLDAMTPDEVADLVTRLERMTPEELERLGFICSFAPSTPVYTLSGLRPIAQVRIGEQVLGYDEESGTLDYYPVMGVWAHLDPEVWELTVDGELIETTANHPFYATGEGWTPAGALEIGDEIQRANGGSGALEAVDVVAVPQTMYNLTVAEAHTYFVGAGGWLVHNACSYQAVYERLNNMTPDEFSDFYQKLSDNLDDLELRDVRAWENYRSRWENFFDRKPFRDEHGTYNIHHGFPKDDNLIDFFLERGIDVHNPQNMFELPESLHTRLPDGIHTGEYAQSWNGRWQEWISQNPAATRQDIFNFRDLLAREFGIEDFLGQAPPVAPPGIPPRIPR